MLTNSQLHIFQKPCDFKPKMSHWGMKALSMACVSAYDGVRERLEIALIPCVAELVIIPEKVYSLK